jgi:SAM-dependent MidA family methyltransferase
LQVAESLTDLVRERGPLTVAAFMDLALYHPTLGYYARVVQRSGRAGDFVTSVDVGPLFGQLLAAQIAEMVGLLRVQDADAPYDLVEAGAGNGRLAADLLRGLRALNPRTYAATRLHLVETSGAARLAQRETLADVAERLASTSADIPEPFEGILIANELLDAMPVHQVVMRPTGLREVFIEARREGLTRTEGPLSAPQVGEYFQSLGVTLENGWRAEAGLAAEEWVRRAARRLTRGFMLIVDYGHEASVLYSASHSMGTLTSFSRHTAEGPDRVEPVWLRSPGDRDLTAHVDFTSVRRAAESEGCALLGYLDQTYFLMALAADRLGSFDVRERLAFKTLTMPGGLGSTMKVLVFGKNVGTPRLRGCSTYSRVT